MRYNNNICKDKIVKCVINIKALPNNNVQEICKNETK